AGPSSRQAGTWTSADVRPTSHGNSGGEFDGTDGPIPSLLCPVAASLLAVAPSRPAPLPSPPNPNDAPCSAVRSVNATHPPNSPAPIPLARSAGSRREAAPATITPPTATTTGTIATRSRNGSAGPSVA